MCLFFHPLCEKRHTLSRATEKGVGLYKITRGHETCSSQPKREDLDDTFQPDRNSLSLFQTILDKGS
jgi:hypothetical protein